MSGEWLEKAMQSWRRSWLRQKKGRADGVAFFLWMEALIYFAASRGSFNRKGCSDEIAY